MVEQRRLASTEWVDIVNEDNEVIAQSSREQMRAQRLRIVRRISSFMMVWVKFWYSVVPKQKIFCPYVRCYRRRRGSG